MNKELPGAYFRFISNGRTTPTITDRGVAALPVPLTWGPEGEVFAVTQEAFLKNSKEIFGHAYDADSMKGLRDLFLNAQTVYFYRLSGGEKAKAELEGTTIATAIYAGSRGNDITITIADSVDEPGAYEVITYLNNLEVDNQLVTTASELVKNSYVEFNPDAVLQATAGIPLTGGKDTDVTGENHQNALTAMESYSFNIIGCLSEDETIKKLYATWTKRMVEEVGVNIQLVVHQYSEADHETVISVENETLDGNVYDNIYWVTGAECACEINKTLENQKYNGEYEIDTNYSQDELKEAVKSGKFIFHNQNGEVRVLEDINTFVSYTEEKTEDFSLNQVIRVLYQIATDTATTFYNKYLGKINNNAAGKISFWGDIDKLNKNYETKGAIEEWDNGTLTVSKGEGKRTVVVEQEVKPVCAMGVLYVTTYVG